MKCLQKWFARALATLAGLSLLLSIFLIFPPLLPSQYLSQINVSTNAAVLALNSTSTRLAAVYEIGLFQYCEYDRGNISTTSSSDSNLAHAHFYPTTGASSAGSFTSSVSTSLRRAPVPSKCHWALPTYQLFDAVQVFGLPFGYAPGDDDSNSPPVLPGELLFHYLKLANYSKCLPLIFLCFCAVQAYVLWFCCLKLPAQSQAIIYTNSPSSPLRATNAGLVFGCASSLFLMILVLILDSGRDHHLFYMISDFYSSEEAPVIVLSKSDGVNRIFTWLVEMCMLSVPISLLVRQSG